MIEPLEFKVGETYAAIAVGERTANSHPSHILGVNPYLSTNNRTYYQLNKDRVEARILVTRTSPTGVPSMHDRREKVTYRDVAIMVKGPTQEAVREYATKLAQQLLLGVNIGHKAPYIEEMIKFLGGGPEVEEAIQTALNPKIDVEKQTRGMGEGEIVARVLDNLYRGLS